MRLTTPLALLASVALVVGACDDDEPTNPGPDGAIQLSAAQASAIRARIVQVSGLNSELAWLADTIQIIVGTGVDATEVPLTTSLGNGPFYAVSLQRAITTATTASAAFDVIIFNNPSDPTVFVIATGWTNPGGSTTTPTTVSGVFGAPTATSTVNAHLFHVAGSTLSAWRAAAGTGTFSYTAAPAGDCTTVEDGPTVTCDPADLNVSFNVADAQPESGATGTRTASLAASVVRGIIIRMQIQ